MTVSDNHPRKKASEMAEEEHHLHSIVNIDFREFTNSQYPNYGETDLHGIMKKLVTTNTEVIHELLDLAEHIKAYQSHLRIAKTTGTSVGAVGALSMVAGLCLAPVTAGTSAMLTLGGMAATATSGVAAVGSELVNHVKSKKFQTRIKELQRKQIMAAIELNQELYLLNYAIDVLEEVGVSQDVAVRTALQWVKDNVMGFFRSPDGEYSAANLTRAISNVTRRANEFRDLTASAAALLGTSNTQIVGTIARETSTAITEAAAKIGEVTITEIKNFRQLVKSAGQSITGTSARSVAKGVGIAAGLVFTIVDVALLVRNWNNPHPLLATVEQIVQEIMKDTEKLEDSIFVLYRLENWGRYESDCGGI